ncbi:MAG: cupin domain-containing protein [Alphaproteobacteria bacterium]|nr:cupin domain-containing protein [Alphaproteobacteria bacterium]
MKTKQFSPEEMENYIARFKDMKPLSSSYDANMGIPKEAYETMTAKTLYLMMAPDDQGGPMAQNPAVVTKDKMSVIIAECPPGNRPPLHAHHSTNETFFCLDGRFRIRWGDEGENEVYLDPYDMIAVPPGVVRDFTNVADETARLLVFITGEAEENFNDIEMTPGEADRLRGQFGDEVVDQFREIGISFDAGLDTEAAE